MIWLWPLAAWAVCGDGHLESSEACDDGAQVPGDGCSASCTVEPGFDSSAGTPTGTAL